MFTGIVTAVGRIASLSHGGAVRRLRIEAPYDAASIALGASIACGGPCLTVVAVEPAGEGCRFDGRRRGRDAGAHHRRRMAAGAAHQPRALA